MAKLPDLTPEDLEKVKRLRGEGDAASIPTSPEMYFVAQFGYHYGWDGVLALYKGTISLDNAIELLAAAEKVHNAKLRDLSEVVFHSTKDGTVFTKFLAKLNSKMGIKL